MNELNYNITKYGMVIISSRKINKKSIQLNKTNRETFEYMNNELTRKYSSLENILYTNDIYYKLEDFVCRMYDNLPMCYKNRELVLPNKEDFYELGELGIDFENNYFQETIEMFKYYILKLIYKKELKLEYKSINNFLELRNLKNNENNIDIICFNDVYLSLKQKNI